MCVCRWIEKMLWKWMRWNFWVCFEARREKINHINIDTIIISASTEAWHSFNIGRFRILGKVIRPIWVRRIESWNRICGISKIEGVTTSNSIVVINIHINTIISTTSNSFAFHQYFEFVHDCFRRWLILIRGIEWSNRHFAISKIEEVRENFQHNIISNDMPLSHCHIVIVTKMNTN